MRGFEPSRGLGREMSRPRYRNVCRLSLRQQDTSPRLSSLLACPSQRSNARNGGGGFEGRAPRRFDSGTHSKGDRCLVAAARQGVAAGARASRIGVVSGGPQANWAFGTPMRCRLMRLSSTLRQTPYLVRPQLAHDSVNPTCCPVGTSPCMLSRLSSIEKCPRDGGSPSATNKGITSESEWCRSLA